MIDRWRIDYNHHRPHSGLDYCTPAAFAAHLCSSGFRYAQSSRTQPSFLNPILSLRLLQKLGGCQPHQMATDYVWLKTQIGLIPSGIPALARIWLKTRLDSKSSESNLVRVRVPPLVLSKTRGFWQGAESAFKLRRISHTLFGQILLLVLIDGSFPELPNTGRIGHNALLKVSGWNL